MCVCVYVYIFTCSHVKISLKIMVICKIAFKKVFFLEAPVLKYTGKET